MLAYCRCLRLSYVISHLPATKSGLVSSQRMFVRRSPRSPREPARNSDEEFSMEELEMMGEEVLLPRVSPQVINIAGARSTEWPLFGLPELPENDLENIDELGRMVFSNGANFIGEYDDIVKKPSPWREIVVMGRSNVGKSSLLNALIGDTTFKFIPVSSKPGETISVNFYSISKKVNGEHAVVLVDAPGYGFSHQGKDNHAEWMKGLSTYLRSRSQNVLSCVYLLIDSRHGMNKGDIATLRMLDELGLHVHVVLTKIDKLNNRSQLEVKVAKTSVDIGKTTSVFPVLSAVSSFTGEGIPELKKRMLQSAHLDRAFVLPPKPEVNPWF